MLKLKSLILALGAISLVTTAMTAAAGSWPNLPARKTAQATATPSTTARVVKQESTADRGTVAAGDFEFVGGEAGWQLRQHKYELRGGSLAHAPDCTLMASASGVAATPAPARKGGEPAGSQFPGA